MEVRTSEHMNNYNTLGKSKICFCESKVCFTKSLEFSSKQSKAEGKIQNITEGKTQSFL